MSKHPPSLPCCVRWLSAACSLASVLSLAAACSSLSDPDGSRIAAIEVRTSENRQVTAADSIPWRGGARFKAVALNSFLLPTGEELSPEWTISDPNILEYVGTQSNMDGAFFGAKGVGTATLTATFEGKSAQVTLKTYLPSSAEVWAWPDTSRMLVGTARVLVVRDVRFGLPIPAGEGVRWESSAPSVATVDQKGSVTTVGEGHATITAVIGGRRMAAEVFAFRYASPLRFAAVTMGSGSTHLGNLDRACGVTTDGSLYCWGLAFGGTGSDDVTDRCMRVRISLNRWLGTAISRCSAVPVAVRPDLRFTSVSIGQHSTCALTTDGIALCWNGAAQLPAAFAGDLRFRSVHLGASGAFQHSGCGVTTSGAAYCWGDNRQGQLGNGTTSTDGLPTAVPTPVAGGLVFRSIRASATVCGITTDGATYCWGANTAAQAGVPVGTDTKTPVRLTDDRGFVQVEPAGPLTCALDAAGTAYCWGMIGSGTAVPTPTPAPVSGGLRFANLADQAPCGVTLDGSVYCWNADLIPTSLNLPHATRTYGRMSGPAAGFWAGVRYAIGTDGLLRWWDSAPGLDPSNFFFHSADVPDGLKIGSATPVLVPGQE